ncbi:site-2 protease family protein [Tundrisphaera sp. TA3]|uniref:site-2 protease family protein n=1 Tax=Tundrisphaera sp. TA3 TaxID=3435775 RepID=UPI003EB9E380
MFGIPAPTAYDLNFRLLGIPVRVSPWFWVISAIIGWRGGQPLGMVLWVGCVFVSILVHEFGHGLTARALIHQRPSIILHGMGGLCVYDREHNSPWGRVAVLSMGPGAGFLLAALVAALGAVAFGIIPAIDDDYSLTFNAIRFNPGSFWLSHRRALVIASQIYENLIFINIMWGLFNLLPIFPLDGGQLASSFLSMHSPRDGQRRAFIVSFVTASLVAVYCFRSGNEITAIFIAYLALINFQFLQAATHQKRYGDSFDDDNWWRR